MKEFLFVFRAEHKPVRTASPEEMQAMMKKWMDWIGSIAAQNKLIDRGNRLTTEGRMVKPGNIVTDGPFMEIKEAIGGYIVVKANSIDEAAELAKDCPIFFINGNVEVRTIVPMDDNG